MLSSSLVFSNEPGPANSTKQGLSTATASVRLVLEAAREEVELVSRNPNGSAVGDGPTPALRIFPHMKELLSKDDD
jgi:hypothetical protein